MNSKVIIAVTAIISLLIGMGLGIGAFPRIETVTSFITKSLTQSITLTSMITSSVKVVEFQRMTATRTVTKIPETVTITKTLQPLTVTVTSFVTLKEITEIYTTSWLTIENEYFVVYYHPGYEADAEKALECAMWVRNNTMNKYPHTLNVKVEIYLYSNREEIMEKEGCPTAISHVGVSGGVLTTAKIGILRPSWEGHWGGYEQLDHPFRRVLNHEYAHIPFYYHLYSKKKGYTDPPSWFSEGLAEYISGNYLPSYEERVREAVLRGSYTIDEPYS